MQHVLETVKTNSLNERRECVCVCVCTNERERLTKREGEKETAFTSSDICTVYNLFSIAIQCFQFNYFLFIFFFFGKKKIVDFFSSQTGRDTKKSLENKPVGQVPTDLA